MIIESTSQDDINRRTLSSSPLSPTATRFQQQQQQQQYHHHHTMRRRIDDREAEQQHEIRPRSKRRMNKERVEHDMNLVYTCSRKINDILTTHDKHDELPHIDALIDTTKTMLRTLDGAKEQWLEQQQEQQEQEQGLPKISTAYNDSNSTTILSSNTSPSLSSGTTTIDHYHSKQQQQLQLQQQQQEEEEAIVSPSPSRSSPSPTSKTSSPRQQRQQQPKRAREHSANTPKQCHSCQSTETPEWRKGPMGPRTLCNACGLIWAKLARQQGIPEGADEEMTTGTINTDTSNTTHSVNSSSPGDHEANKYALSYLLS